MGIPIDQSPTSPIAQLTRPLLANASGSDGSAVRLCEPVCGRFSRTSVRMTIGALRSLASARLSMCTCKCICMWLWNMCKCICHHQSESPDSCCVCSWGCGLRGLAVEPGANPARTAVTCVRAGARLARWPRGAARRRLPLAHAQPVRRRRRHAQSGRCAACVRRCVARALAQVRQTTLMC